MIYLDFTIVGGGTAGIAAAYTLRQAGHRVRLIENHGLDVFTTGAHLSPNTTKILRRWFGDEEVESWSQYGVGSPFLDVTDSHEIGYMYWSPAVMKEVGADYRCMNYSDLRKKLYQQAISAGVRIDLNTSAVSVRPGTIADPRPTVTLSTGEVIISDMVIGADGAGGIVRKLVVKDDVVKFYASFCAGLVPAAYMESHPRLSQYLAADEFVVWMGKDIVMCGFPMRNRTEYAIRCHLLPGNINLPAPEEVWDDLVSASSLRLVGIDPVIVGLIRASGTLLRYSLKTHDTNHEDWVDESGRIMLIGDAAHVVMIGAHSHSLALEDAVVLGRLLERLSSMEQLPMFLQAFQQLRQPRRQFCAENELGSVAMTTLPPGPETDRRNTHFPTREDSMAFQEEEGLLRRQLEEYWEIFGYDATDAADEWWVQWGRFSERQRFVSNADQGPGSLSE